MITNPSRVYQITFTSEEDEPQDVTIAVRAAAKPHEVMDLCMEVARILKWSRDEDVSDVMEKEFPYLPDDMDLYMLMENYSYKDQILEAFNLAADNPEFAWSKNIMLVDNVITYNINA